MKEVYDRPFIHEEWTEGTFTTSSQSKVKSSETAAIRRISFMTCDSATSAAGLAEEITRWVAYQPTIARLGGAWPQSSGSKTSAADPRDETTADRSWPYDRARFFREYWRAASEAVATHSSSSRSE